MYGTNNFDNLLPERCLELIEKQGAYPRDKDCSNDHRLPVSDDVDSSEKCNEQSHLVQGNITSAPTIPLSNQLNLFDGSISLSLANSGRRVIGDVKYGGKYDKHKSTRGIDDSSGHSQRQGKKVRVGSSNSFHIPDIEKSTEKDSSNTYDDSLDVGLFIDEAKVQKRN